MDSEKETLKEYGGNIKEFTDRFCKANKRNTLHVLADKLHLVTKLIERHGHLLVAKACEHCLGLGEIQIDHLEAYINAVQGLESRKSIRENKDAFLRGKSLLVNDARS